MDCIDSVAFTDVCACVSGSGMARSSIKSEYAKSLVDPKRTLFDVNIERRRYSSDRLIGAVTALFIHDAQHTPTENSSQLGAHVCVSV